jgi:hypothetical protein
MSNERRLTLKFPPPEPRMKLIVEHARHRAADWSVQFVGFQLSNSPVQRVRPEIADG